MPDINPLAFSSSLSQDGIKQETKTEDVILPFPQASSTVLKRPLRLSSRYIGGIELIDEDLDCLQNKHQRINGTVMNAYANLVSIEQHSILTTAGYILISSLVPPLIHGKTSCGTTLENIVSVVSMFFKQIFILNWILF